MALFDKLQDICRRFCGEGAFLGYETIQVGNANKTYGVKFPLSDRPGKGYAQEAAPDGKDRPGLRCFRSGGLNQIP